MLINLKGFPGIQLDTIADFSPTAAAEVQTVQTISDVNGSLGGRYFHLYSRDNITVYTVWFDVGNSSTNPRIPYTTAVEVDISSGDSATNVASALQTAVNALADFSAIVVSGASDTVEITNVANGAARTAHDPDRSVLANPRESARVATGFTFAETTKGITDPTIPASLNLYVITGRKRNFEAVQQGNEYREYAFRERTITTIVPVQQIVSVIED